MCIRNCHHNVIFWCWTLGWVGTSIEKFSPEFPFLFFQICWRENKFFCINFPFIFILFQISLTFLLHFSCYFIWKLHFFGFEFLFKWIVTFWWKILLCLGKSEKSWHNQRFKYATKWKSRKLKSIQKEFSKVLK
jgi:hypothetical protein